jgi:peptidoglycan/xylan/chitin deacetylase (PgdA/CDA1 family)
MSNKIALYPLNHTKLLQNSCAVLTFTFNKKYNQLVNRFFIFIFLSFILLTCGFYFFAHWTTKVAPIAPVLAPMASPTASPSATPTPRPLTFKELNDLYGPCAYIPTLMYHHIQPLDEAKAAGHLYLAVAPETFRSQMQYIKDRGYNVIQMSDLIAFFDSGASLPKKPILITIDDGYKDNYIHAFPILKEFSYPATIYLSTGLMGNGDYLDWNQIGEMSGHRILMNNHTWSHKNLQTNQNVVTKEIQTAGTQLADHNLNNPKTFAYPYGSVSIQAKVALKNEGYTIAFTTRPGSALCKQQRLDLPRIRIGNSSLSVYGL